MRTDNALRWLIYRSIIEISKYKARRSSEGEVQVIRKLMDVEMSFSGMFVDGIFKKLIERKIANLVDEERCTHGESLEHKKCCVRGLCCRH